MDSSGRISDQPAPTPRRDSTSPALRSSPSSRLMTTGLVLALLAICSEVATRLPWLW